MPAVAAVAMIAGAGLQAYGTIKSAADQAQLDSDRAMVATEQAHEIEQREIANEAIRDQGAYRQKLQFAASYAASGKAGAGVGGQLQIQNQADLQNMISNKEAKFQEFMLYQQAGIDTTLADETLAAGNLSAAGSLVGGIGSAAGVAAKGGAFNSATYGGTQGLGPYPTAPMRPSSLGAGAYGGGS